MHPYLMLNATCRGFKNGGSWRTEGISVHQGFLHPLLLWTRLLRSTQAGFENQSVLRILQSQGTTSTGKPFSVFPRAILSIVLTGIV